MSNRANEAGVAPKLTEREALVLSWLRRGVANKEIAAELSCSVKTIEFHVSNLLRKYGVQSRLELVVKLGSGGSVLRAVG